MKIFYNDNDKYICKWIETLIAAGLIPDGVIDGRSIEDIKAHEIENFTQCHFFAGIAGWVYALILSGWPEDKPVWTGSCPCQPFSVAGKGKGIDDKRHLWPQFYRLIEECRPATIFGEQVSQKAGRQWLNGVRLDLEALGYAFGAADIPAASVGAPHIRQRLWWVADAKYEGPQRRLSRGTDSKRKDKHRHTGRDGAVNRLADTDHPGGWKKKSIGEPEERTSYWRNSAWVCCIDGKQRRIPSEPALFPLADGLPGRVGLLRGAGNAIVPQVAAQFIGAYMDIMI